ncbi:transposase [Streptomyces sp. NPDC057236]|uniref:transposase n=1 Tax=Streptomyces sp. NPDC057236 TaxID=3346059 RepID=UPI00363D0AAE
MPDEPRSLIEPLPPEPEPEPGPKPVAGRPRVPDRQALRGILFALHTGIQWKHLPGSQAGTPGGRTRWRGRRRPGCR